MWGVIFGLKALRQIKVMRKVILYNDTINREVISENRLYKNLLLSPANRMKKAYMLMAIAAKFKNGPLRNPMGLGIILKKKRSEPF
jgi:hypothetical protein